MLERQHDETLCNAEQSRTALCRLAQKSAWVERPQTRAGHKGLESDCSRGQDFGCVLVGERMESVGLSQAFEIV